MKDITRFLLWNISPLLGQAPTQVLMGVTRSDAYGSIRSMLCSSKTDRQLGRDEEVRSTEMVFGFLSTNGTTTDWGKEDHLITILICDASPCHNTLSVSLLHFFDTGILVALIPPPNMNSTVRQFQPISSCVTSSSSLRDWSWTGLAQLLRST